MHLFLNYQRTENKKPSTLPKQLKKFAGISNFDKVLSFLKTLEGYGAWNIKASEVFEAHRFYRNLFRSYVSSLDLNMPTSSLVSIIYFC